MTLRSFIEATLALIVTVGIGCGDAATPGDDAGGSGGEGAAGAGAAGAGGSGDGGHAAPAPTRTGFVYIDSGEFGTSASAAFRVYTRLPSPTCAETEVGDCVVVRCDPTDAGEWTFADVGASVQASTSTDSIELVADGSGYAYDEETVVLFDAGDTVEASAPGSNAFPAFTVEARAPANITVTSPAGSNGWNWDRSDDLVATWTVEDGSSEGLVVLSMFSLNPPEGTSVNIECVAPIQKHTLTVPAAALLELSAGDAFIFIIPQVTATVALDDAAVDLTLTGDSDGAPDSFMNLL